MRICAALLQEEHFREVTLLRAGRKLMSIQVVYKCLVHVDDPDSYALSSPEIAGYVSHCSCCVCEVLN